MAKEKQDKSINKMNAIRPSTNIIFNILFIGFCVIAIIPVLLVFVVSFTAQDSVMKYGYSFFPKEWSLSAYKYLFADSMTTVKAYGVTIYITIIGTVTSLLFTSAFAYPLSRNNFQFKQFFATMVLIPMLFSGGMTASYIVNTNVLHLKNNLLVLILPGIFNGFSAFIMRTYFKSNISDEIVESAYLDGASEWVIYTKIVLPLAVPILATMGFSSMLGYWNEWFGCMMYITDPDKVTIQYLLVNVLKKAQFFKENLSKLGGYGFDELAKLPSETMKMAMAVVVMAPILCAYPFFQKYFIKGMTIGSVKG